MPDYDGLVFLPGLMCDQRLFAPQVSALESITAIEVGDITRASSTKELARSVLEQTRFKRFALAGLSMGGIVAMEMLHHAPERIERLALLDTNHLPDDGDRMKSRFAQLERVRRGELVGVMMEEMKPLYVAPQNMGDPELNATFMAMAKELGPEVFERQVTALLGRRDATEVLAEYKGKTLVLCGEHDRPCPPSRHCEIAGLNENSILEIVPDAGHVTILEQPAAVNSALLSWLG